MRAWRYGLGALGVLAVLFGLRGLLTGGVATDWPVTATWLVVGAVAHDLVLVPVVAAVGWLVHRLVPASVRPAVRGGLVVAAVLTAVALPVLTGKGDPRNPSLTPLNYPRNYAYALLAVVVGTAVAAAVRWRRATRTDPPATSRRPRARRGLRPWQAQ